MAPEQDPLGTQIGGPRSEGNHPSWVEKPPSTATGASAAPVVGSPMENWPTTVSGQSLAERAVGSNPMPGTETVPTLPGPAPLPADYPETFTGSKQYLPHKT